MLGAAVAEAFDAGLDGAQAEGLVGVRLEGVADDVGAVQLDARPVRRAPEFGAVIGVVEGLRHARDQRFGARVGGDRDAAGGRQE